MEDVFSGNTLWDDMLDRNIDNGKTVNSKNTQLQIEATAKALETEVTHQQISLPLTYD